MCLDYRYHLETLTMEQLDYFLTGLSVGLGSWVVAYGSHRIWCFFRSTTNF